MIPTINLVNSLSIIAGDAGTNPITLVWNGADKTSGITLDNDDLDAIDTVNTREGVRATIAHSTGKWYIEFPCIALGQVADAFVGFGSGAASLTANGSGGIGAGHYTNWRDAGNITQANGGFSSTPWTTANVLCCAADIDNDNFWWRLENNAWLLGGDPAAATSPTATATGMAGDVYPLYVTDDQGTSTNRIQILGHAANQIYSPPSGFTPWGD